MYRKGPGKLFEPGAGDGSVEVDALKERVDCNGGLSSGGEGSLRHPLERPGLQRTDIPQLALRVKYVPRVAPPALQVEGKVDE